jgi:hypothetical protein
MSAETYDADGLLKLGYTLAPPGSVVLTVEQAAQVREHLGHSHRCTGGLTGKCDCSLAATVALLAGDSDA